MREAKKSLAFRPRARPVAVSRPAQTHTKTQRQTRSASVWLSRALQREKEIARPIPQGLRPTPTHIAGLLAETDPWSRATAAPALLCPKPLQRPLPLPNPNPYPGRAHARPFYGSTLRQRHDPLPCFPYVLCKTPRRKVARHGRLQRQANDAGCAPRAASCETAATDYGRAGVVRVP